MRKPSLRRMRHPTLPGTETFQGYLYERTKHSPLEKAFADHWEEQNIIRPGGGLGLLQNLFFFRNTHQVVHMVNDGERFVSATVVQWLGTNVGFSFLNGVLREENLYIADIPNFEVDKPDPKPAKYPLYSRKFA